VPWRQLAIRILNVSDRLTAPPPEPDGRLWQERNQARQDALRYNQERNEARAELVALRTQQSAAAVRSASAPIFPLSAE
jgi:hypothetical protein